MERVETIPHLPARRPETHKGDYGRVIVVGGSRGMAGAPCLCGRAALRSGAGLVTVAVPQSLYQIVAAKLTNCMTRPLPEAAGGIALRDFEAVREFLESADVLAVGPGAGRSAPTIAAITKIVAEVARPMVIDADGLFALASASARQLAAKAPRILTPHPGEMARLLGLPDTTAVQQDREGSALRAVERFGGVIVLKGHRTIVTDGQRLYVNNTGNPGMATGGTGDVLTGVIAGLLAQGLSPFQAAQLGVYIHGLAGDIARDRVGETSLVATDVLRALPAAFLRLRQAE